MLYVIGRDGEKIPVPREVEVEGGEAIRAWVEGRQEPEVEAEDEAPEVEEESTGEGGEAEDDEEESDE